jgi:hypothetical protein
MNYQMGYGGNTADDLSFTAEVAANALTNRLKCCRPKSDTEKEAYEFLAGRGGIRGLKYAAAMSGKQFSRARAVILVNDLLQRLRASAAASPIIVAELAQELRELWVDPQFR